MLTRPKLIVANWKMNMNRQEVEAFCAELGQAYHHDPGVEVAICPPYVWLDLVGRNIPTGVALGAQNVYFEPRGAFTGEISALMLKDLGCRYVIIGHSERRHVLGEDDLMINRKLHQALLSGLIPIFCVGEKDEERRAGKANAIVAGQIEQGLKGLSWRPEQLVIAYEPVWAIGTGNTASGDDAREMAGMIREQLVKIEGEAARQVRILYGGSVTPENARELMAEPDVDGALVGGASLHADKFAAIVESGRGLN